MSTLARVVYSPDTTPPTTPISVTASALSQTSIRVSWTASTDTGGSGLAGYRVYRSATSTGTYSQVGTDLTTASLSYDDAGLSAGTTYYYRVVAVDGNSNASSQSATASATTVSSGATDGNDGLIVTSYASYDPDAAQIISLDINNTIPSWGSGGGASMTFANETWWNGTASVCTLRPPTIDQQNSGFGAIPFWKNGTKTVRQINIRWEWHPSPIWCENARNYPKFIIIRAYPELNVNTTTTPTRPMMQMENYHLEANHPLQDTIAFSITEDTVRMFSSTNITPAPTRNDDNGSDPTTYPATRQPIYYSATAGADAAGNPIMATTEIVTIEVRVNVMATVSEPNGLIGMRIYRRNGQIIERCCSWRWAGMEKALDTYFIADIDSFGGGYFNNANDGDPNLWCKVGRRVTFGINYQPTIGRAWLGPPTGFVI